jgi:hypothetical protein
MTSHPQCSLYATAPHAPACHCLPLISSEHSNDGEEKSGSLNGPEHFSQEPHYIHDKMIDVSPVTGPNNIHDFVPEDDVSIVMKSKMKWRIWKGMPKYCYCPLVRKSYRFGSTTALTCVTIAGSYVDSNSL